jgi:hypothetical protein
MTSSHHDATTNRDGNLPRGTLRGYLVRHRLALLSSFGSSRCFRCCPEPELANGRGVTPYPGISAVHGDDVHVHEARDSRVK